MKKLLVIAALLAASPVHAATFALDCSLKFNNQQQDWNLSFDPSVGKYTARIGDQVVKRNQEYQVDYSYGGPPQSVPQAVKLIFLASPMDYFLIIHLKSYLATSSSVSGASAHTVGSCSEAKFKGL
jgi:hypothetical protein